MMKRAFAATFAVAVASFVLLCVPFRASADTAGTVEGVVKSSSGHPDARCLCKTL